MVTPGVKQKQETKFKFPKFSKPKKESNQTKLGTDFRYLLKPPSHVKKPAPPTLVATNVKVAADENKIADEDFSYSTLRNIFTKMSTSDKALLPKQKPSGPSRTAPPKFKRNELKNIQFEAPNLSKAPSVDSSIIEVHNVEDKFDNTKKVPYKPFIRDQQMNSVLDEFRKLSDLK